MLTLCQPENGFFLLPVRMTSVDKFVADIQKKMYPSLYLEANEVYTILFLDLVLSLLTTRRKFAVEEVTHRAQVLVPDLLVRLREVLHPDLLREQMVEGLNVS